jgi:hypothetical protein
MSAQVPHPTAATGGNPFSHASKDAQHTKGPDAFNDLMPSFGAALPAATNDPFNFSF